MTAEDAAAGLAARRGDGAGRFTPISRFRTHQAIVEHLDPHGDDVVVDLGCGNGVTLVAVAARAGQADLIGLDLDAEALRVAADWLEEAGARFTLHEADLSEPLPLAPGVASKLVCHDVVELLADPLALVEAATACMRPGAVSLWSHTDFDSVVVHGADPLLTRRVVHANADYTAPSMGGHSDGQMGRKLAALIGKSPLETVALDAHVLQRATLAGPARARIDDMMANLRPAASEGAVDLDPEELETWLAALEAADARGEFFYAQTAYMVIARRRSGSSTGAPTRPVGPG